MKYFYQELFIKCAQQFTGCGVARLTGVEQPCQVEFGFCVPYASWRT